MTLAPGLLARFRAAQRRTQEVVGVEVSAATPGISEAELAARIRSALVADGARGFFHEPLVWFGPRTAFAGIESRNEAHPGATVLRDGDPIVVDVAPVLSGCAVDVSHTASLGEHPTVEAGRALLRELRAELPGWITAGMHGRQVASAVVARAARSGFESRQSSYLFGALAHRVFPSALLPLPRRSVAGLGLASAVQLFGRALGHRVLPSLVGWPFWNDSPRSERAPAQGLWSFEPHLARDGVGVKWEELFVVDEDGARWLDETCPLL